MAKAEGQSESAGKAQQAQAEDHFSKHNQTQLEETSIFQRFECQGEEVHQQSSVR